MANESAKTGWKSGGYNFLGKSGIRVSNLCLGGNSIGNSQKFGENPFDESGFHKIVDRFVELGGNFIDTADGYSMGKSEQIIGTWLEKQTRDDFVISTKIRLDMKRNINDVGLSRRHITDGIERSLERLRTNYIDLYHYHLWDFGTPADETLRTIDDLIRCGKVRYAGASCAAGWQMMDVVHTTDKLGLNPFVTLQQQYNLLVRHSEQESIAVCKLKNMGVIAWSPLKGGLLTGKYKRGVVPKEGRLGWVAREEKSRTNHTYPAWSELDDQTFDIIETVERIAGELGKTPAQVALRWLIQKDVVASVAVGVSSISQLEGNMAASHGWGLSAQQMKELDDVSERPLMNPYEMSEMVTTWDGRDNHFLPTHRVVSLSS